LPVAALVPRALVAAIAAQLSVAGVVLAAGGPVAEAAVVVERAEILDTVGLVERDVRAATATEPIELAVPATPPVPTSAVPAPEVPAPPATTPPTTAPPTTPAPAAPAPAPAPPAPTAQVAPAPAPAPEPASSQTSAPGSRRDADCEVAMLGWMSEARAGAGLPALADDPAIDHVAFGWSDRMAASGRLEHNPRYGDEVFAARPEATTAGEVVGRGPEPRPIFDEFLRSPAHRDAILRPAFTHATVGCVRDGGGQVWVTANFWG